MNTRRIVPLLAVAAAAGLLAAGAGASSSATPFPATIALPTGFQPEGIAIHRGRFFVGSIPTGAIYSGWKPVGSAIVAGNGVALEEAPAPAASRPAAAATASSGAMREMFMPLGYPEPRWSEPVRASSGSR